MLILCADDYALTEGVSRAIGELAAARRLSATSVMVTSRHWPAAAPRLCAHRGHLALGLHLNLTLGAPLGSMSKLAPRSQFPGRHALIGRALFGVLAREEVRGEIERQLDAFEKAVGHPPDYIDGHEHMHVLPGVRSSLLAAIVARYGSTKPLVRDPSDRWQAINARRLFRGKALVVSSLAARLADQAARLGIPTNSGFSGFSAFDESTPYADELAAALINPGPRHIIMCHPGHPDAELAALDPVVQRRRMEYDALMRDASLPDRIWRPARAANDPPVNWLHAGGTA